MGIEQARTLYYVRYTAGTLTRTTDPREPRFEPGSLQRFTAGPFWTQKAAENRLLDLMGRPDVVPGETELVESVASTPPAARATPGVSP